eukprot:g8547.t1
MLTRVAAFYSRNRNLAPLLFGAQLYGLTDILANRIENCYTNGEKPFNPCRTLGVMAAAPVCNGSLIYAYRLADFLFDRSDRGKPQPKVGVARISFTTVCKKVAFMQLFWTPTSICLYVVCSTALHLHFEVGWEAVAGKFADWTATRRVRDAELEKKSKVRVAVEGDDSCWRRCAVASALFSNPWRIGFLRLRENFWEIYLMSWFVWPLSDLFNFRVVQMHMTPHFRATWDAGVGLVWNTYQSIITFRSDISFARILL